VAYKGDELYIVSNDGKLYTFSFKIKNRIITHLEKLEMTFLKTNKRKVLKKKKRDAEGLCFLRNNLLISFERKHRIELYSLQGEKLKSIKVHKALENKSAYKSRNRGLESVAYNHKYGIVTAPEIPLYMKKNHVIYAKDRTWKLKVSGKIKALEFINDDELLIVMREKNWLTKKKETLIYHFDLKSVEEESVKFLFKLNGNFEGLTKVYDDFYVMVSDSEDTQKAELVLFELKD
jgi:Esterase-like activity of phytase